ncbi:MAG TPA: glycosidase [bacterium]|nr:glycosidase [bacterium]
MIKLTRLSDGPIISPRAGIDWEKNGVFNPGVCYDGKIVHMLYRAFGEDNVSRLGYAFSRDGINFEGFLDRPVFDHTENPEEVWGCEDPRITKNGDDFYISYTALSPKNIKDSVKYPFPVDLPYSIKIALAKTKDFRRYEKMGTILHSPDKDAALFPEKINNHQYLFHRVWPNISLAKSKNLEEWIDLGAIMKPRAGFFDSYTIGVGAPPIKTELGWLVFYHGVDEALTYCLGIFILDLNHPEEVLYRSSKPILEPKLPFEREGFVKNVVFTCGAVEIDGNFYVYYGGADTCIGVAMVKKKVLLKDLVQAMQIKINAVTS